MIDICVDEAYAFDYYAIMELKFHKGAIPELLLKNLKYKITKQIGLELFKTIMTSDEYKKLYAANSHTFDAVDKAKTNQLTAQEVDKTNYERMLAKKTLQNKFFKNKLSEKKIGYETYEK
jgi:hypothetical protein